MPGQDVFGNDIQSKVSIRLSSYLMKVILSVPDEGYYRNASYTLN